MTQRRLEATGDSPAPITLVEPQETPDIKEQQERRLTEILDSRKPSVLLVIDMQNDFVANDGKSVVNWRQNIAPMQAIIPKIEAVTDMFHVLRKPVIRTINYEDVDKRTTAGRDRALFMEHVATPEDEDFGVACIRGTKGAELALPAREGDVIIEKNRSSAYTPELKKFLTENGIATVFITGVKTQRCIEATLRDLYDQASVHVVLLEDCVASDDIEQHKASLKEMRRFYPPVITSAHLREAWSTALAKVPQPVSV